MSQFYDGHYNLKQDFTDQGLGKTPYLKFSQAYYVLLAVLLFFSSPELKAQVSYSDRLLSVVCLSVRLSVCKLLHF
jgi:hypothetical protein